MYNLIIYNLNPYSPIYVYVSRAECLALDSIGVLFPGEGHVSHFQLSSVVYSSLCRAEAQMEGLCVSPLFKSVCLSIILWGFKLKQYI